MHEHTSPDLADMAVLCSSRILSAARRRYADYEAQPIKNDRHRLERMGVRVIQEDLTATGRFGTIRTGWRGCWFDSLVSSLSLWVRSSEYSLGLSTWP